MQKFMDESMIDVCKVVDWPLEQIFFILLFFACRCLYLKGTSKHRYFVCEGKQLMKILGIIFGGDFRGSKAIFLCFF